jgi:uncharacterized protein
VPAQAEFPKLVLFQGVLPPGEVFRPVGDRIVAGDPVQCAQTLIRGDDGSEATFRAGDAFLTPAGFTGTWQIVEPSKKFYAVYE